MRFEILILGNSSATPMYDRHPTAQVLNFNEQLFLIDCGEGTQMQLFRFGIKSNKIGHIFISHLHGDHYLGLVGLLSSMNLSGRKSTLHLYGPKGLLDIVNLQFEYSDTRLQYDLVFHATNSEASEVILQTKMLTVTSFPLSHRLPTTGFRFDEGRRSATLLTEKVQSLQIPLVFLAKLKKGMDCTDIDGTVYKASEVTLPAPESRSYAFCSDTRAYCDYMEAIRGVDLLYHETTFLHELVDRAVQTFHSTALEAGDVAAKVGAKKLLMGHYSARYKDLQPILSEAKTKFDRSELSEEGKWYLV